MYIEPNGNAPDFFIDLVNLFDTAVSPYTRGPSAHSTTGMSRGVLEDALRREYPNLEKSVFEGIASMDGTMLHKGLEDAAKLRGDVAELRRYLVVEVEVDGKTVRTVLSGSNDYQTDNSELGKVMVDWKRTKAYAPMYAKKESKTSILIEGEYHKEDWVWQLNVNRLLAESPAAFTYTDEALLTSDRGQPWGDYEQAFMDDHGRKPTPDDFADHEWFVKRRTPNVPFHPDRIQIGAILKDWDQWKAGNGGYPLNNVEFIDQPFLPDEEVMAYIRGNIVRFEEYRGCAPSSVPDCSDKQKWKDDDEYKVYWSGSTSANPKSKGNTKTLEEAQELLKAEVARTGKPHRVEFFEGMPKKCQSYCDFRFVCPFGKAFAIDTHGINS